MDYEEELENEKNWLARTRVDPEKFFFFYEKYYDRILGYLYRITLDYPLAEDLTSETFLKAQQMLWRFRWQRSTFGGWLFKIASNEAVQYFRRKNLEDRVHAENEKEQDSCSGVLAQLEAQNDLRLIMAEIDTWRQERKTIFMLHVWQGLSHGEIAKTMRISRNAVAMNLSRARRRLRKVLADEDSSLNIQGSDESFEDELNRFFEKSDDMKESG